MTDSEKTEEDTLRPSTTAVQQMSRKRVAGKSTVLSSPGRDSTFMHGEFT